MLVPTVGLPTLTQWLWDSCIWLISYATPLFLLPKYTYNNFFKLLLICRGGRNPRKIHDSGLQRLWWAVNWRGCGCMVSECNPLLCRTGIILKSNMNKSPSTFYYLFTLLYTFQVYIWVWVEISCKFYLLISITHFKIGDLAEQSRVRFYFLSPTILLPVNHQSIPNVLIWAQIKSKQLF